MSDLRPVLEHLRTATALHHQLLEDRLDAVKRLGDMSDRGPMLLKYYRMHASAEAAVTPWLAPIDDLQLEQRRRTPALADGLAALGLALPCAGSMPLVEVCGKVEALGILYVLEGSSLGGRMIRKAIAAQGRDLTGLGFLDPYGAEIGARWREFLAILEREGAEDPVGVSRGGVRGFAHAYACLMEAQSPALAPL